MIENILFEGLKLAAQLVGAIVVARLAVKWALDRYKSEQIWARRLAVYVDTIQSLGEMRTVLGEWEESYLTRADREEQVQAALRDRYFDARRKLQEVAAIAELILTDKTVETLQKLEAAVISARGADQSGLEMVQEEWTAVGYAIEKIIADGRAVLGSQWIVPKA